jgi:arginase
VGDPALKYVEPILSVCQRLAAAEMLAETGRIVGLDLVEFNPILDRSNATADLAVELALSALGERVWGTV